MRHLSLLLFSLLLPAMLFAQAWEETQLDMDDIGPIRLADLDGDGDLDILHRLPDGFDSEIEYYRNDGDGVWTTVFVDDGFAYSGGMTTCDVDNDGDTDIVVTSKPDHDIYLLRNLDGTGTDWGRRVIWNGVIGVKKVHAADFDGDGNVDLLVGGDTHFGDPHVSWLKNLGCGLGWSRHVIDNDLEDHFALGSGDIDGDGDLDVLAGGQSGLYWYVNQPGLPIQRHFVFGADQRQVNDLEVGDIDGDGDNDLAFSMQPVNDTAWPVFYVALNEDGLGTAWSEVVLFESRTQGGNVHLYDLDGDGDLDLLGNTVQWCQEHGQLYWFEQRGSAETWVRHRIDGTEYTSVDYGDTDGDGWLDVVGRYKQYNDSWLTLYRQTRELALWRPNGGERWRVGSTHEIRWNSDLTGTVDLTLLQAGEPVAMIAQGIEDGGVFEWSIPAGTQPSPNCRVRVVEVDEELVDVSDQPFQLRPAPDATLTPADLPIVIPEAGGQFDFSFEISNPPWGLPGTAQVWTVIVLPSGDELGPAYVDEVELASGETVAGGPLTQTVPGYVEGGTCQYVLRVGSYPDDVLVEDSFPFVKLGTASTGHARSAGSLADWTVTPGWSDGAAGDDARTTASAPLPGEFQLAGPWPNPFNAEARIKLTLPEAGRMHVTVHDITGRQVAELAAGRWPAGRHELRLDGAALASGVYLLRARLDGGQTRVRKAVLLR